MTTQWTTVPKAHPGRKAEEFALKIGSRESRLSVAAAMWIDARFRAAGVTGRYVAFQINQSTGEVALLLTPSPDAGVCLRIMGGNGRHRTLKTRLYTARISHLVRPGDKIPLRISDDGHRLILEGVYEQRTSKEVGA